MTDGRFPGLRGRSRGSPDPSVKLSVFDKEDGDEKPRLSLMDAGYFVEHRPDNAVLAEACKSCAADAFDGVVSLMYQPR